MRSFTAASGALVLAKVAVAIDKSAQRIFLVFVDGSGALRVAGLNRLVRRSTGREPLSELLKRVSYARKVGMSPNAAFDFLSSQLRHSDAIYVCRLGYRAPHGCVWQLPENAAILFSLVEQEGIDHTRIVFRALGSE